MKMSMLFITLFLLFTTTTYSQDYNETIDVGGTYEDNYPDQSKRLEKMRRRLEKRNELMVRKRIEHIRYQNEMKLIRDTQRAMNKILKN